MRLSEEQSVPPAYDLIIENCDIAGWSLRPFGGRLIIQDSTINSLRPWHDAYVLVGDSYISERLMFWDYSGTTGFQNAVVADWLDSHRCSFLMTGTVRFENATIVYPGWGPWEGATIHRQYPVEVRDWQGSPLGDAALTLQDEAGPTVWTGNSDVNGKAVFTLMFTETNYLDTWQLTAAKGYFHDEAPVSIS